MVLNLTLDTLSTELIIKVCSYLEIQDLCHFKQTCKRFNDIINIWDNVVLKGISTSVVTNQSSNKFVSKCFRKRLTRLEKLRVSRNWITGRYLENSILISKIKLLPFLQLTNKHLWISCGEDIRCYERKSSKLNISRPHSVIRGKRRIDIVNFQIKNGHLVAGLRDGSIIIKNNIQDHIWPTIQTCHTSDVNSVDISQCGCTVVSGSRNNELKIWRINENNTSEVSLSCNTEKILPDLIWKVSLAEENFVAVGTAGNNYPNSLYIFDLESLDQIMQLSFKNSTIQGIFDVRWDGLHSLWSCGFDSYLRRWDLRTGNCEQSFLDPCGSALYCLDFDHHNTVLTGAQLHGRVTLWDIRQDQAVQMYFMEACKSNRYNRSSPVHSLAFDADFLFTATDQNLNILDFSVYNATPKDYGFFLNVKINNNINSFGSLIVV